jgi:pimeloyl-ACP methyl ester carboxylesterase
MAYDLSQLHVGKLLMRRRNMPARTLIVLVHSLRRNNEQWRRLLELAGTDEAFAECDFYLFAYDQRRRAKVSLGRLGAALSDTIDLQSQYERIILVGYSLGGLIVRAAFVHAIGASDGAAHHDWARKVSRIVLLATPNRGLGGRGCHRILRMRIALASLFGSPLIRDARRGSDFITNLRLDWVFAFRNPAVPTPEVIQLLGSKDDIVKPEDSNDVVTFREVKLFTVSDATHTDLADFRDAADERYVRFRRSCFDAIRDLPQGEPEPEPAPPAVVFELHGIRDYGSWLAKFEQTIKGLNPRVRVVRPGYGYFSALGFITPWIRRRRVAWFCDCYTQEVAALATANDIPFFFVGHSYGTYLLAESLNRFPRMHFLRACLVGSVVPESWELRSVIDQRQQISGVRNDCASRDWPVAICCGVLKGSLKEP